MNMRGRERLTPEQEIVYEANLRLGLHKLSMQRHGEWLDYHIKIWSNNGIEKRIMMQAAVRVLINSLANHLEMMGVSPDDAAEELRTVMYEQKARNNDE